MIVFTYPGQGSQRPGMGLAWASHPSWELVEEASEAADRDVARLLLEADAVELTKTRNSQLATFVMSMVVLDAVTRLGAEAAGHAGHSLGEYSALTASGVLDFSEAVQLVTERGDAMQAAADEREGTMAAILGLDDDEVQIACSRAAGEVWIANHNAPGQVVIAGAPGAIEKAGVIARQLGAKRVMALPVGGAFHTPFMSSARDRLAKALDKVEFRDPEGIVIANVDACAHEHCSDWPDMLKAQLCSPVRWRQTIQNLHESGFSAYVELGPGAVLTGLTKRSLPGTGQQSNIGRTAARVDGVAGQRLLPVGVPDDLDGLLEALAPAPFLIKDLAKDPAQSLAGDPGKDLTTGATRNFEGEHLFATERLVVSPGAGVFTAAEGIAAGTSVAVGHLIGHVGNEEVRSAFAGDLMGVLALEGERVMTSQPIAWLRSTSHEPGRN